MLNFSPKPGVPISVPLRKFDANSDNILDCCLISEVVGIVDGELISPEDSMWMESGDISDPNIPAYSLYQLSILRVMWSENTATRRIITDYDKWYPVYQTPRFGGISMRLYNDEQLRNCDFDLSLNDLETLKTCIKGSSL